VTNFKEKGKIEEKGRRVGKSECASNHVLGSEINIQKRYVSTYTLKSRGAFTWLFVSLIALSDVVFI